MDFFAKVKHGVLKVIIVTQTMMVLYLSSFAQSADSLNHFFSRENVDRLLVNNQLDSLIGDHDTLKIYFNNYGSFENYMNQVLIFRRSSSLYVINEVISFSNGKKKEKKQEGLEREYITNPRDTLSFEQLFSRAHCNLSTSPDTIINKRAVISIGMYRKWGRIYYADMYSDEYANIRNYLTCVMHKYFPEIDRFTPLIIVDEVIIIDKFIDDDE